MAPLVIRFISGNPNESLDQATQTLVRSHAMSEVRRRQRHQKALAKEKSRRQQVEKDILRSVCTCISTFHGPKDLTPVSNRGSRVGVQRLAEQVADSYKICPKCRQLQFFDLSTTGQRDFLKKQCPSITGFMAEDFDPFASMAMPDLGLSARDAQELNRIKAHAITFCCPGPIRSVVFPEAMRTPALCMSMLYMTYAYLASVRGWSHQPLALAMKTAAIREINQQLADPNTASRTATIASIAYLSTGTWAFGAGAEEVSIHKAGMELVVQQRGIDSFSDFPFEQTIRKYLVMHHTIICAMLIVPTSTTFQYSFNSPPNAIPHWDNIQESPFYCPTGAFTNIARSPHCSKETLQILYSARALVSLILDHEMLSPFDFSAKLRPISAHLCSLSSSQSSSNPDYIYMSTRYAALITLEAISRRVPLTSTDQNLTAGLIKALEKTDIGDCWGDIRGVLYWVALTGSAASQGRDGCRMLDSTLGRSMFQMTFTGHDNGFEEAVMPARVFGLMQEALRVRSEAKIVEEQEHRARE